MPKLPRKSNLLFEHSRDNLVHEFREHQARYERALEAPGRAQVELLLQLLRRSADTEIGRHYRFAEISSAEEYRDRVPLHSYQDLQPWIQRISCGENDILFPGAPLYIAKTSGTTNAPKMFPVPQDVATEYAAALGPFLGRMEDALPGAWHHGAMLTGRCSEGFLPNKIMLCSASGAVRNMFSAHPFFQWAPEEAYEESRADERYLRMAYHLLLREDLRCLAVLNPSTLLTLFEKIAAHRQELMDWLRSSTEPRHHTAFAHSESAADRLRAARIHHSRVRATDLWPELSALCFWRSAGARHYVEALKSLCPDVAFWPTMTSSTESTLLVPVDPQWGGGCPTLLSSFFEFFVPEDEARGPVPIEQLEVGQRIRCAVTNSRGLYRYLMDDVFMVQGHYRSCPVLELSHRLGQTSSLTGEKLTAPQVCAAVGAIGVGAAIAEFQVWPRWGDVPYYVLTVEVDGSPSQETLEKWLRSFEEELQKQNPEYRAKRSSLRLGAPELWVLAKGTYASQRRDKTEKQGRSDAQYKHRHLTRDLLGDEVEGAIECQISLCDVA